MSNYYYFILKLMLIGDWGLGIGDWGLGNPQSPIPNPQIYMIVINIYKYKSLFVVNHCFNYYIII